MYNAHVHLLTMHDVHKIGALGPLVAALLVCMTLRASKPGVVKKVRTGLSIMAFFPHLIHLAAVAGRMMCSLTLKVLHDSIPQQPWLWDALYRIGQLVRDVCSGLTSTRGPSAYFSAEHTSRDVSGAAYNQHQMRTICSSISRGTSLLVRMHTLKTSKHLFISRHQRY